MPDSTRKPVSASVTTILNVDDNEANRYAISRMLKRAGFATVEAASGEEALRLVANRPDLVILDARSFEAAPVATVRLPHRIPPGFHGNWFPDA